MVAMTLPKETKLCKTYVDKQTHAKPTLTTHARPTLTSKPMQNLRWQPMQDLRWQANPCKTYVDKQPSARPTLTSKPIWWQDIISLQWESCIGLVCLENTLPAWYAWRNSMLCSSRCDPSRTHKQSMLHQLNSISFHTSNTKTNVRMGSDKKSHRAWKAKSLASLVRLNFIATALPLHTAAHK